MLFHFLPGCVQRHSTAILLSDQSRAFCYVIMLFKETCCLAAWQQSSPAHSTEGTCTAVSPVLGVISSSLISLFHIYACHMICSKLYCSTTQRRNALNRPELLSLYVFYMFVPYLPHTANFILLTLIQRNSLIWEDKEKYHFTKTVTSK